MNSTALQAFILAAGRGSRFNTGRTKLVEPLCGQAMILYPIKLLQSLAISTTVILGYQKELLQQTIEHAAISNLTFAEQTEQRGTGHALLCAQEHWGSDSLLVLNGDMPLISPDIINTLYEQHKHHKAVISFITAQNTDPNTQYGRIIEHAGSIKIVEKKHFIGNINEHPYINAGIYLINRAFLERHLKSLDYNHQTQELYITDLVEKASTHHLPIKTVPVFYESIQGINTFQELASVEFLKNQELIHYWMTQGVRFISPHTTNLHINVTIGKGTVIHPGVQLLGNTSIGTWCTIQSHAVLDNAHINDNSVVPPHAFIEGKTTNMVNLSRDLSNSCLP